MRQAHQSAPAAPIAIGGKPVDATRWRDNRGFSLHLPTSICRSRYQSWWPGIDRRLPRD